jgi:DNA-binding MarR family transcriptional regulator
VVKLRSSIIALGADMSIHHELPELLAHFAFLFGFLHDRASARILGACCKESGVTPTAYFLLLTILKKKETTQKQISQLLGFNINTVTRVVDRLEKQGLAARVKNPSNRKENFVEITPLGASAAKVALQRVSAQREWVFEKLHSSGILAEEERAALHKTLLKLFSAPDVDLL